jgi:hypothetical protein
VVPWAARVTHARRLPSWPVPFGRLIARAERLAAAGAQPSVGTVADCLLTTR